MLLVFDSKEVFFPAWRAAVSMSHKPKLNPYCLTSIAGHRNISAVMVMTKNKQSIQAIPAKIMASLSWQ